MVVRVSIRTDIEQQLATATAQQRARIQRAADRAVRAAAFKARDVSNKSMATTFDKPTPTTQRATGVSYTKGSMQAEVFIRDQASGGTAPADYLAAEIEGGERLQKPFERLLSRAGLLPAGWQTVPGRDAPLTEYGNMTRSMISQILSWMRVYREGGPNISDRLMQRRKKGGKNRSGYEFICIRPGAHKTLPPGIYRKSERKLQSMLVFIQPAQYEARLDFVKTAGDAAAKALAEVLPAELNKAARRS